MPTLDECKEVIWELSKKKGWGTDPETKMWYAVIELAEAGDAWKHRGDPEYLLKYYNIHNGNELKIHMFEELIDTIYYCLHCMMCIDPEISADNSFERKHHINLLRNRVYLDDKVD